MKKVEVLLAIEKFEKALEKLKEGVKIAKTEIEKDGVIQRFEFTFELFWKTLKIILQYKGIETRSPRSAIKEAFRAGLIDDDEIFLDMLEDRNLTSHIYDEVTAEEIFKRIKKIYTPGLEKTLKMLKERV
ncbi:nucleotidyltransferase substrate binding protein [Thermodesulfobacterium hydrogeniphilum]|uniref:nucleotidyltransferase substrate binding protein n=1 Tax=Thermodesulfobacterium hydrogeniphilum TaxID=161156 RepID=UPI00068961BB|nr:nucleotidyltransferase substrate binding protein [Thermodesulfobacterium hydrogeniphilum]